jgi:hypothetical protein
MKRVPATAPVLPTTTISIEGGTGKAVIRWHAQQRTPPHVLLMNNKSQQACYVTDINMAGFKVYESI